MKNSDKDPDFAFKLERAIVEKYGEKTVINPKKNWCTTKEGKYLRDLKIFYKNHLSNTPRVEHNGFLVSKKLFRNRKQKTCDLCSKYEANIRDKLCLLKYDCCFFCFVNKIEGRE